MIRSYLPSVPSSPPLPSLPSSLPPSLPQVLVNHPKTNLNLKCDGGLTPLMLAVKQCNQKLVRQLIKKNVDINTADSEGM